MTVGDSYLPQGMTVGDPYLPQGMTIMYSLHKTNTGGGVQTTFFPSWANHDDGHQQTLPHGSQTLRLHACMIGLETREDLQNLIENILIVGGKTGLQ